MNDFREIIKGAAGHITTDRDIVSEAADRAAQSRISGRHVRKLRPAVCVLIAAVMLCGMSVSAVRYGWLNAVFGTSGDVISENYDRYHLEISEPEIDNRLPECEITLNEVISDGRAMYIDLQIEDHSENKSNWYNIYDTYTDPNGEPKSSNTSRRAITSGDDFLEMYLSVLSRKEITVGDKMVLKCYKPGNDSSIGWDDDYDFLISFTVEEEPEDMSLTWNPEKEITFASGGREGTTVAYVENVVISPLSYKIKGHIKSTTVHRSDAIYAVMDMSIPVFVLKDGTRISMIDMCDGCGGEGGFGGESDDYFAVDAVFTGVLPIDELARIEYSDSYIEVIR